MSTHKDWTDGQRFGLASDAGFACAYCQVSFGSVVKRPGHDARTTRMEVDHLVPVAWTGVPVDAKENLIATCQVCNKLKGDEVFDSVDNARRYIDRLWVSRRHVVLFVPTRSNFEDPEGWALEYARYLRATGQRNDSE